MQVQSVISYELQDNLSIPRKDRKFALCQHFKTGSGPLTFYPRNTGGPTYSGQRN